MANNKYHLEPEMYRCYRNDVSGKDIADKFGVTEQLVSKYKEKFEWERRKRDWNNSNRKTLEDLLVMREKAVTDRDADAVWKIQKTIQAIDGMFDKPAYTIEIMDDYLHYLKAHHRDLFAAFQEILPDFLAHQREQYLNR